MDGYASHLSRPQFVSSSENLYVIDRKLGHPYRIHELDFAEMKWVLRENTGEKYAFFLGKYWKPGDKTGEGKFFHASMWHVIVIDHMESDEKEDPICSGIEMQRGKQPKEGDKIPQDMSWPNLDPLET
uniref:Uncharacterized protein n=2 Tax=Lactuca sativa TaxID=4236 RepID=A0A9R1X5D9_LACSA|nr:hypothetical protein LSAT_V11C700380590 [Lactuca sativa]KAJ0198442.1 hypothetical protein LSAT_V11C700380620 [Lactuca sativa]